MPIRGIRFDVSSPPLILSVLFDSPARFVPIIAASSAIIAAELSQGHVNGSSDLFYGLP
jgi:hypothetical protein